jgi:hypothetical protein
MAFIVSSCFDPPEYPNTPTIEFAGISFVDTPDSGSELSADTLALRLDFTDGDGDLGLNPDEIGEGRYSERYYFKINDNGRYYTNNPLPVARDPQFVKFSTRRTTPGYDTLPTFTTPFKCINWEIVSESVNGISTVVDTLYFQLNPNHYNIFVDFLVKQDDGSFEEFDFRQELCTTFDGRIPELSKEGGQSTPLEGTIRYAMASIGFKLVFGSKTLKLRVQIQDRALNRSNVLETPEFNLQNI